MQRFLQAIHDTNGVTACNKQGAVVHALNVNVPILGSTNIDIPAGPANSALVAGLISSSYPSGFTSFAECEVFKIDNLAAFYLDSIVGAANLYFRDNVIRNGVSILGLTVGTANVGLIENSSYIGYDSSNADKYNGTDPTQPGFWDSSTSQTFRPKPAWLDRLVFFDQVHDSPNAGPDQLQHQPLPDRPAGHADGRGSVPRAGHPRPVQDEQHVLGRARHRRATAWSTACAPAPRAAGSSTGTRTRRSSGRTWASTTRSRPW